MAGDAEEWAAFVASSRAWAAARGGGDMTRLLPSPSSKPKGPPPGTPEPLVSMAKAMLVPKAEAMAAAESLLGDPLEDWRIRCLERVAFGSATVTTSTTTTTTASPAPEPAL